APSEAPAHRRPLDGGAQAAPCVRPLRPLLGDHGSGRAHDGQAHRARRPGAQLTRLTEHRRKHEMKTLNIAEDLAATTDGSSDPVDLVAQRVPFLAGFSVVLALNLQELEDAIVQVQGSDTSDFSDTPTVYF